MNKGVTKMKNMGKKLGMTFLASAILFGAASVSADEVKGYSMYRLYNPNSGEHFYTKDAKEQKGLVDAGWKDEGTGWYAPASGSPVYRLYNKNAGDHHYTLSQKEKDSLVKAGWKAEGIGWYSESDKGTKLYRAYNKNAKAGSHNYTLSSEEQNMLVKAGWKAEGIAWYGMRMEKPKIEGITDTTIAQSAYFDAQAGVLGKDFLGHRLDVVVNGKIDTKKVGTSELSYTVTDQYGQKVVAKRKITVVKKAAPVFEGIKNETITQSVASFDVKAGVKAKDDKGNELPFVVIGGIDSKRAGEYYLAYQATNEDGITTIEHRKITVVEQADPIISGAENITVVQDLVAFDSLKGVQAKDANGKSLTIQVEGKVDEKVPGVYLLTYSATDQFKHQVSVNRLVTITLLPEPQIKGIDKELTVYQTKEPFDLYAGVSAVDGAGRPLEVKQIDSVFHPDRVGLQQLYYETRDAFGTLVMKVRTIQVLQVADPTFTVSKELQVKRTVDKKVLMQGITAKDYKGRELQVELDPNLNLMQHGTGPLSIYYTATDEFGNRATFERYIMILEDE